MAMYDGVGDGAGVRRARMRPRRWQLAMAAVFASVMSVAADAAVVFDAAVDGRLWLRDIRSAGGDSGGLDLLRTDDVQILQSVVPPAAASPQGAVSYVEDPLGSGLGFDVELRAHDTGSARGGGVAETQVSVFSTIAIVNRSAVATYEIAYDLVWSLTAAVRGASGLDFADAFAEAGIELLIDGREELRQLIAADARLGPPAMALSGVVPLAIVLAPLGEVSIELTGGIFGFAVPVPGSLALLAIAALGAVASGRRAVGRGTVSARG